MFNVKELLVPLSGAMGSEAACTAGTCTCTATGWSTQDPDIVDRDEFEALEAALLDHSR